MTTANIETFQKFQNDEGTYTMTQEEFMAALRGNTKVKKPQSAFFLYLNSNREDIKKKYFSDFNSIEKEKWDNESFKNSYYSSKDLKLSEKSGKPRLVSLVTSKAGIIWKSMVDEEKQKYVDEYIVNKEKYNKTQEYFK